MAERGQYGAEARLKRSLAVMPQAAILEFLAAHRVFGGIPASARAALAPQVLTRRYKRGHYFFQTGDPAGHVFVIVSGMASLSEDDPGGRDHDLYTLSRGDIFGIAATMLGIPRTRSAKALSDSIAMLIGREMFDEVQRLYPEVARNVTLELCRLLCLSEKSAGQFALKSVPSRLARLFVETAPEDIEHVFSSHRQIAIHIGCSRETVSRVLSRLARESIVSIERGRIRVLNRAKLNALANAGAKTPDESRRL
jgi:CRP-like cAMP-binding protein